MTIACPITSSEKALPIHANMNIAATLICRIAPSLQCAGLNSQLVSHDLARHYHVSKNPRERQLSVLAGNVKLKPEIPIGKAMGSSRNPLRGEAAQKFLEAVEMKTMYARLLVVGSMIAAGSAWASEPSPVAFAKSVVSERGSQTFATVSYPDKNLIVQFRLEPYSTGKATAVRAFGEITKKIAQGAFSRFPKLRSVQLIGNLSLRDKHGNDTVDRAVMAKFSKLTAARIKWENVEPTDVIETADQHWISPALGTGVIR